MAADSNKREAIVVLPAVMGGRVEHARERRWLSRSKLALSDAPREIFERVLSAAGLSRLAEGLAALRLWGQTGDRPNVWLASADPVHLEARSDHLRLHALVGEQSPIADLRAIFDHLHESLGGDTAYALARVGEHGYLRSDREIATASLSASAIDGMAPDEFMPSGESAADYHRLSGEIQMCLHDHEVNLRREEHGLMPVNSIWFWGGGMAPDKTVEPLPPLFGDDPLFTGYWESRTALISPWPGSFSKCLDLAVKDFVAVTPVPDQGEDLLTACLAELRDLLRAGRLHRLVLLFRDGLTARFGRFDAFRLWRRTCELL
ncbi:MAG: hypothetical protein ACE5OQ_00180 [Woeseia sp.]